MAKYHIDSVQEWESFEHNGTTYCLKHLNAHKITIKCKEGDYCFIVTYGLHCFAKDDQETSIPLIYEDAREKISIDLERYELSKCLKGLITKLEISNIYQTNSVKFFTVNSLNNLTGEIEPYKVCLAFFKEHRLPRIHVTSAYFARTGEGSAGNPIRKSSFSIFKIIKDFKKTPKDSGRPKEANNRTRTRRR